MRTPAILRQSLALMLVATTSLAAHAAPARPNILWITFEDASPTLGCYGDAYALTPNLDALAARSIRYTRAFAPTGVCATSRSSLITGMFASTLGTQHMRSVATLPAAIRPFPAYLREAGYYCSNNVKTDYNFPTPAGVWDDSSNTAHWRGRPPGQPFFAVFNSMITHESRIRADPKIIARLTASQRHDPAAAILPPWLTDTPAVRQEWARYHDLLTIFDTYDLPAILRQLEDDGLADDTIIFVFSDQGVGVPRAKTFIFEAGLQVPLLVHFPPKWRHLARAGAGTSDDRLVSLIDLAPTVLSLAGVKIPDQIQGLPLLGSQAGPPRERVHAIKDRMGERIDMSRTVRDSRFKYQRNYLPYLPHYPWHDYMDRMETSKEFRRLAAAGQLAGGQAYFMAGQKDLEELYDLAADPHELNNLAKDPRHAAVLRRLREEHFAWARGTVDTGFIPEQMLRDYAAGSSEYEYARSGAYELERCIKTARLMERGDAAVSELIAALQDHYPPVRFWAAAGLANLGTRATPALAALQGALTDPAPEVALTAAEALCYAGRPDPALPVIAKFLQDDRELVALTAANVADRIGDQARPIIEVLRRESKVSTGKKGSLFEMVDWVLAHALRKLDGPLP